MTQTQTKAVEYLGEGFSLLKKYSLYSGTQKSHLAALERVAENLPGDPNAAEIAAAFQAMHEAKRLIGFRSAVDGKRIILSDYFIGLAVKLILPLRNKGLMDGICNQINEIGSKASNPFFSITAKDHYKQIDELCRGYLESNKRQQADTSA